jgi:hypothetical protein
MPFSANLLPALDAFVEAASVAQKWRQLRPMERKLTRAMSRAFRRQGRLFLVRFKVLQGKFEESITEADWLSLFDTVAGETIDLFLEPIQTYVQMALVRGAESLIAELEVDTAFSLRNPRAVAYLEQHGAELVRGINDTTRDQMRTLITQAGDEGWSYTRLARSIRHEFDGFAGLRPQAHIRDRATLVAVTELGEAYEAGSALMVQDLQSAGLQMEKSWSTIGDDRVSAGCQENAAAGWIPFDDEFPSSDMRPLRFPGCRCTALYRRARG